MPIFQRRFQITIATIALAALCGVLCGYFLARFITVKMTEIRLDAYATRIVADGDAYSAELRTALAAVDAAQYRACSSGEIGYLRALIFESEFLKDAGLMRDGRVLCSAALGLARRPGGQEQPDFTQQDGTAIYRNLAAYESTGVAAITLRRGDSFVVFTPLTRMHLEPPPMHFAETATDSPTQTQGWLLGDIPGAGVPVPSVESIARQGDRVSATRCSIRFFNCVMAYTSIPEIVRVERTKFTGCIVLCGLFGALVGLACSVLYRRNKSIEYQLRRAIRADRVRLAYQPVVDLTNGRIVGAEALARWTDEEGHPVGPDVFIKIAEQRGFVGEITRLVVRHVLREFGSILRANPGFRISINVTAADLADAGFVEMLEGALTRAAVPAPSLTIEITESSTARHDVAIQTIRRLRQYGHSVHIDDFGTGYSSLAYLSDLSVDAIKIDKAFTQAIGTDSVTVGILPQILAMAETLSLNVIVEGVETTEQASYFAAGEQRVLAQGWLFGKPVPAGVFQQLLPGPGAREEEAALIADRAEDPTLVHLA